MTHLNKSLKNKTFASGKPGKPVRDDYEISPSFFNAWLFLDSDCKFPNVLTFHNPFLKGIYFHPSQILDKHSRHLCCKAFISLCASTTLTFSPYSSPNQNLW